MANNVEGGKTPLLSAEALQEIGYAAVAFPVAATYVIAHTLQRFYALLKSSGETTTMQKEMSTFSVFHDIVGLPQLREFERGADAFARDLIERLAEEDARRRPV
jgi:2-methylisocitrate lyase-like PEP mutase family enzyme